MSLQFNKTNTLTPLPHRYFLYLRKGRISNTIYATHPALKGIAYLAMLWILKMAGITLNVIFKLGGTVLRIHRRINAIIVEFKNALTPEEIAWLEKKLGVDIEPVKAVQAYLNVAVGQIGMDTVRATTGYSGNGIKVAVVDTGINDTHPDLAGKVIARYDFSAPDSIRWSCPFSSKKPVLDGVGHGTWCAGAIAGGGKTYQGMAPKVALIDARVLNSSGHGSNDAVILGMSWAADQGADIISMSLGSEGTPDDAVSREADALTAEGIVIVVAAGNEGPHAGTIGSPSCAATVITVGAVDQQNKVTQYSSRGPVIYKGTDLKKPDLVAPGGGTTMMSQCFYQNGVTSVKSFDVKNGPCTVNADATKYERMSGTSMATPIVAGVCALILEAAQWTVRTPGRCELVKQALKTTVKALPYTPNDAGVGLIDANAAIKKVKKS